MKGGAPSCEESKMTFDDVNILGNLINTTYGKSSSAAGEYSIKCDLAGNVMTLKYTTLVYFVGERGLDQQINACRDEAQDRLTQFVTNLKKDFKDISGSALKTTDAGVQDDIELIQSTSNSPRKIAYYRMNHTLTVG